MLGLIVVLVSYLLANVSSFFIQIYPYGTNLPEAIYNSFLSNIQTYSLYFAGLGLFNIIASYLMTFCWYIASERIVNRIKMEYMKTLLLKKDLGFYRVLDVGHLMDNLSSSCSRIMEG